MPLVEPVLVRVVDRLGVDRLADDAGLVRVALKDVFPDDPLVVSLLTAAVEHGALAALRDDDERVPLAVLGPRLADQLHRESGIAASAARWAVGAWAAALGLLGRPLPESPSAGSSIDDTDLFSLPADRSEAPPVRGLAPAPVPTDDVPTLLRSSPASEPEGAAPPVAATPSVPVPTIEEPMAPAGDDRDATRTRTGAGSAEDTTGLRLPETVVRSVPAAAPVRAAPVTTSGSERRPRRRVLLPIAALVALLLVSAGVTALVLRPSSALAVDGSAGGAAWTVGGGARTVGSGAVPPVGATVEVRSGTLALRAGASVLRLAAGAHARINGADDVTLTSGRAFALAGGHPITVRSTAGAAEVSRGRAMMSCTTSACTITTLDTGTVLTSGSTATTLHALQQTGSGAPMTVFADAIRADPWFTANDRSDRQQGLRPVGVQGRSLTGTWLVSISRADLPFPLSRTVTVSPACGGMGCTLQVATRMSDGVPESRLSGTARAVDTDGSRLSVDYGSHSTRCHWQVGLKKGQGVDGRESVSDELAFSGSAGAAAVTGTRTSTFTADGKACGSATYTATKQARLTGSRATAAQRSADSLAQRWSDQQAKLNYVADAGSGCAAGTAMPKADLQSDLRCTYPAKGDSPASVELGVYATSAGIRAAYDSASKGLVASDSGDCATGPCEAVAPNGHGRFLLTTDPDGAELITYDPRAANLLLIVHGRTMRGLSSWWSAQQRTKSVYSAFPIPRVGV